MTRETTSAHPLIAGLLLLLLPALAAAATPPSRPPTIVAGPLTPVKTVTSLPAHAIPGSTAERRAAWNRLTKAQQDALLQQFKTHLGTALKQAAATHRAAGKPPLGPALQGHARVRLRTQAPGALASTPTQFTASRSGAPLLVSQAGVDEDGDGLPDDFEAQLADAFTPVYHVSAGEQPGTGFAIFGDYVPQTVVATYPPVPPISYYRVTPVGFTTDASGQTLGFLELDYLTLWNQDDGLAIGGDCWAFAGIVGGLIGLDVAALLDGLGGHYTDDERSAALVAAPLVGGQFSLDPNTYSGYSYYTAAHESTFFDHSSYLNPGQPIPANYHLNVALTQAKHGTYTFNPDHLPLFPDWVIATTYFAIDDLYFNYFIDFYQYLAYQFIADTLFYSCVVEHFGDQGGTFAGTRINVGEETHPINGSTFIQDPKIAGKLNSLLWVIQ
jgi:hypothetical protein